MTDKIKRFIENQVFKLSTETSEKFKTYYLNSNLKKRVSSWINPEKGKCNFIVFFYDREYPIQSFQIREGYPSRGLEIFDDTYIANDRNRCIETWEWLEIN
jgi:hypothetical protein